MNGAIDEKDELSSSFFFATHTTSETERGRRSFSSLCVTKFVVIKLLWMGIFALLIRGDK